MTNDPTVETEDYPAVETLNYPAVNWSEGMFLCPQHFQASDKHWHEVVARNGQLNHGYHYGVRKLEFSVDALATGHVAITACEARFKDGALAVVTPDEDVRFDFSDDRPTGMSVMQALKAHKKVRVFLAASAPTQSGANVASDGSEDKGAARFVQFEKSTVDDATGADSLPVDYRKLNLRVLLSTDDQAGYELLPIFQVRSNKETGKPEVDPNYFPPVLAIEAWPPLGVKVVRRIFERINGRADELADDIINRKISFSSHEAGDLERMLLLHTLNEAIGSLTCLSFANGVHPFVAYRMLCELVGRLSIFGSDRRIPDVPQYNHDDLARIFHWVQYAIEGLAYDRSRDAYDQEFFVGQGPGLQVGLKKEWFDKSWEWYVGARPKNFEEEECKNLFKKHKVDWVLGASNEVAAMYRKKKPGVELAEAKKPPRVLPATDGWVYFKVIRDSTAWNDLKKNYDMAIRLNPTLIREVDKLQGKRRLEVVVDGEFLAMEFAVFAINKSQQPTTAAV